MNHYMIEIDLPELTQELISLIPQQRKYIDHMMNAGTIRGYTLSADRSRLWVVLIAASEKSAVEIISNFPIAGFIQYNINMLAFHNAASYAIPVVSWN